MGNEHLEEADIEVLPMWPNDLMNAAEKQFNIETMADRDMLDDVTIGDDPSIADFKRLLELTSYSEKGSSQLAFLVKSWEYKQANAARLLNQELSILSIQQKEAELKKIEIIEAHRFDQEKHGGKKRSISILEEVYDIWGAAPMRRNDVHRCNKTITVEAEYDTVNYWRQFAIQLEKLLEDSIQREQMLMQKLKKLENLQSQSTPVDELSHILNRADNYLHFILQTAPVVIGHQDKELRYRFIYNHFPRLGEEDIIGKTDIEIFTGLGVKESHEFKREVMDRGLPAKREIAFETELFGKKTFLIYVEPVFSKDGETIGVNYVGMDVTDQVIKREKMVKLREEIAVQKAKETELNKTIHITEETMRAKHLLATMSHEIRSPLSGVVSMAEILANTKLDKEQHQLLDVMISSGDLVLQLINDILDLSKVESGVMKLEATKFRPREVVKHVLQTAAASLRKQLTLEGHVAHDVPIEVMGDVLRIRQILTNLISNAVKFTHEGKVGINLQLTKENSLKCQFCSSKEIICRSVDKGDNGSCNIVGESEPLAFEENQPSYEKVVILHCDVYDTGIGIPETALPTLFKEYMQVSADHARKYGGTGLGLAICKQLVELMGGRLTVTSQVNSGSVFTFLLPCKVPREQYFPDDSDGDTVMFHCEAKNDIDSDKSNGSFLFKSCSLCGFSLRGSVCRKSDALCDGMLNTSIADNRNKAETFDGEEKECHVNVGLMDLSNCHNTDSGIPHEVAYSTCSPLTSILEDSSYNNCQSKLLYQHCRLEIGQNGHITSNREPEFPKTDTVSKILLVEDNKINIMVAKSMLKQLGHKIDVVHNGLEAIREVQRAHYDLILMDVCLPVMDGLHATKHIRTFEEHGYWDASVAPPNSPTTLSAKKCKKRTAIVAMTANAMAESAADCLANGMDSFVSKPVTFHKLKECLQQFLLY